MTKLAWGIGLLVGLLATDVAQAQGRRGARRGADTAPQIGAVAPTFELPRLKADGTPDEQQKVKLESLRGKKPVALVFGSYT